MTARTDVEVNTAPRGAVSLLWALLLVVVGAAAFNGAFAVGGWGPLIVVFLFCAVRLTHAASAMGALLLGLLLGVAAYAPQAYLLTGSFGIPALTIIGILALCVAIFAWVGHQAWRRLGPVGSLVVLPFLWTGLEYCRAELCPPRFSWLTTGLAMPPEALHRFVGSYGVGFVLMGVAAAACSWRGWNRVAGLVVALGVAWGLSIWQPEAVADTAVAESNAPAASGTAPAATMADAARATGATTLAAAASAPATAAANTVAEDKRFPNPLLVTLPGEHPNSRSVAGLLNAAAAAHPEARFFFLTEYAMALNDNIARWCGTQKKYVIAATQVPVKGKTNTFRLTAAVTKSDGNTGLIIDRETPLSSGEEEPSEPELLETGWGKMGVVIFHDLGHRKEMDAQVRAGARALVVVAPDVEIWGLTTQDEHSRIPAVRAVEYGIPIVRATSNGLSQIIAPNGQVVASSGADHVLAGHIPMTAAAPHVPIDALGGPICMILAALYLLMELGMAAVNHTKDDHPAGAPPAAGPGNVPPAAPSA